MQTVSKTTEPIINCPNCDTPIKLTESLAAPLVERAKREYEQRLQEKTAEWHKREGELRHKEDALAKEKETWRAGEEERLKKQRDEIAKEESRRATLKFGADLDHKAREISSLQAIVKSRDEKLADAARVQTEFLRKERELQDQKRELELTIETRVQQSLAVVRDKAQRSAEEAFKLKVLEKEQTIVSMQRQIEDLKRRAEQGSQQLQGEVQEQDLERTLAAQFPVDSFQAVKKGEQGGDLIQRVVSNSGNPSGCILWETKRTKNWSDGWLSKLREDQRNCRADVAVIVSHVLPKGVQQFELIGGVWVTEPRILVPLACVLRQNLIELETIRRASEGQHTKAELVYRYLSSTRFRQRVQAIVEAFNAMQQDLDGERRVITRQWAKRQEQIEQIMRSTVGMYGDLQGIAGKSIQEIEGLALEGTDDSSSVQLIAS